MEQDEPYKENFIILFEEKEGSSVLVRLLERFEQIAILHQEMDKGWEPFDQSTIGQVRQKELMECISSFYHDPLDFNKLNRQYRQLAQKNLHQIDKSSARGFKMRWSPPGSLLSRLWSLHVTGTYQRRLLRIFKEANVTIFLLVRQDLLRWALSRYHGDGTGRPGHLQWKVADGTLNPGKLDKLNVNLKRLGRMIEECRKSHIRKQHLVKKLKSANIEVIPIRYEDFLSDQKAFLKRINQSLNIKVLDQDVEQAIAEGGYFRKVHSEDISTFVKNHEEVLNLYGKEFLTWT